MTEVNTAPQRNSAHTPKDALPLIQLTDAGLERITVCARPFRAPGPRIEHERLGDKHVVHNYGHGGSGWSLSWGSAFLVRDLVVGATAGMREIAVIGCGALGLTSARVLQQAGFSVTIYARDLPFQTRSSRATGSWTPDSRIALATSVDSAFAPRWEEMTRASFAAFEPFTRGARPCVAWTPHYVLSEVESDPIRAAFTRQDTHGFFHLISELGGLTPSLEALSPAQNPWGTRYGWRAQSLTFQVLEYQEQLLQEFRDADGRLEIREFNALSELLTLPQSVLVHCTGIGARDLFSDRSLMALLQKSAKVVWDLVSEQEGQGCLHSSGVILRAR